MIKMVSIVGCILVCTSLNAQGENNIWYFGANAGLDFGTGTPVPLLDGQINTSEGCAVVSDPTGALMFYTDGIQVWDRDHNQMPNGFDLDGGWSTTQSALIVPVGSIGTYYIFTAEDILTSNKQLSYSAVDMSLNGGYGDVTLKNVPVMSQSAEKLAGTRNSDGSGVWVMAHSDVGNAFHAYLVTATGIAPSAVVSYTGQSFVPYDGVGQLKFSPDGTRLAIAAWGTHFVELFDFDANTGVVTNPRHINMPASLNSVFGLEFSFSGQRLYAANVNPGEVFQWDLSSGNAATINASITMVSPGNGSSRGHLQLGPDEKIYVADENFGALSVINAPEMLGAACAFVESGVGLGGANSELGLPNVVHGTGHFPTSSIEHAPQQLLAYPAVFTDRLEVRLNAGSSGGEAKILVRNIAGALVYEKGFSGVQGIIPLELGDLTAGVYSVEMIHNADRYRCKVIKQ